MPEQAAAPPRRAVPWRLGLLVVLVALAAAAYAGGLHRQLSLETLVRHRAVIDGFINTHYLGSLALFVAIYIGVVALSIPAALLLTVVSGALFGPVVGPLASMTGATTGGVVVFLIARTALGEHLLDRIGPAAEKLAAGFRSNAFSYLLFLRLAPVFPFWLVNLAAALFDVPLRTFIAATILGIAPAAFAFGFVGSGLDSAIAAQQTAYKECLAAGRAGCRLDFDVGDAVTPEVLLALGGLAVIALLPVVVQRLRRSAHG